MRFELAGSLIRPDPLILEFKTDETFDVTSMIDIGYTHFEVICIGGGGGSGGGIDTNNTGTTIRSYGGAGGGGGFQRVRGLLSILPSDCPIVVGSAGSPGSDHSSNPALTTDGGDGEASTFNTNTCRASGGKGGKRVQSNSTTVSTQANGGDGGVGNRILAGGGAAGGTAGIPSDPGPGTPGTDGVDGGIVNAAVGKGGGGGAGGVGKYDGTTCNPATSGGRGSWNPGDSTVYGPGEEPSDDISSGALDIIPGNSGGAKGAPLNKLPIVYGRSDEDGIVIVRLTADVASTVSSPPIVPGGSTLFGSFSRAFTLDKAVAGIKNTNSQISLPITFGKSVSGIKVSPKQTPLAQISLASHGTPTSRTQHSIHVRARTTSGSGGVIQAALWEGVTMRSELLTSDPITNSLEDYILAISDEDASSITDYSNLSIKFAGYVPTGAALEFEISDIYLELPSA